MKAKRRAVIDVGTNSIKLLVGDVSDGLVSPVDERSEQTRLGAGFYDDHVLQAVPITRTASAVARFVALARELESESLRIVATSAARDAKNPDDLLEAIRRAAGLRVEIISGEQEAEWVFRGVTSDPKLHGKKLLILDVGGGSTEFILGEHDHHSFRQSFPMGSVRLLEQLRPADPPSLADIANCRQWLGNFFGNEITSKANSALGDAAVSGAMLVGTGGSATILGRMEHQMKGFDREIIEGTRLSRAKVLEFMVHLWSLPLTERRRVPGLPAQRADVILMGVAIYESVMNHLHFDELCISTRGLRFGALSDSP